MNKTKIEWCDYTVNPVKGLCPMSCDYCYARRMYKRFGWDEKIAFTNSVWNEAPKIKKPSRIFVGSTMELFGEWIDPEWLRLTLEAVKAHSQHTFIFLTKRPENLTRWSPFPKNCWVGMSYTGAHDREKGCGFHLEKVEATVKFLSFEPLLGRNPNAGNWDKSFQRAGIGWVILGSQTQPTRHPPRKWVDEIITAADQTRIPVFVKEPMASHYDIQRKEFPSGK